LMVERLHRVGFGAGIGRLVFSHALLERLDALGNVAHQIGNLSAPAEKQKPDGKNHDPVPHAQRAHEILRVRSGAPRSRQGTDFSQKLCAVGGKNKRNPSVVKPAAGPRPSAGGKAGETYSSV